MKIGIINGDESLKIKIKDKNVHIKLVQNDTDENFDILIFNKQINFIPHKLLNHKYVLINIDEYKSFNTFSNIFLITYGMNNKASITASSIERDKLQICVQRNLAALNGKIIEEQEFGLQLKNIDKILYQAMSLAATNILFYGDTNNLLKWF